MIHNKIKTNKFLKRSLLKEPLVLRPKGLALTIPIEQDPWLRELLEQKGHRYK